jgi:hypothetical protein
LISRGCEPQRKEYLMRGGGGRIKVILFFMRL